MISARHIGPNAFILTIVDSEAQESIFVKDLTFLKTDVVKIGDRRYLCVHYFCLIAAQTTSFI